MFSLSRPFSFLTNYWELREDCPYTPKTPHICLKTVATCSIEQSCSRAEPEAFGWSSAVEDIPSSPMCLIWRKPQTSTCPCPQKPGRCMCLSGVSQVHSPSFSLPESQHRGVSRGGEPNVPGWGEAVCLLADDQVLNYPVPWFKSHSTSFLL